MPTFPATYSEAHVEQAALDTLRLWYHDFLAEQERRHGITPDAIVRPRSWQIVGDFDDVEERQLPCVAVSSPGVQNHEWTGDGRMDGWVQILVGIAVQADTKQNASRLAKIHLAAIRQLLISKAELGGTVPITGLSIDDASNFGAGQLEIGDRKVNRASGVIACLLLTEGLAFRTPGPDTPTSAPVIRPPADPAVGETVDIDIAPNP